MLSIKRLCYVLLIVVCICGVFFIYNINDNNNRTVKISNKTVEEQALIQNQEFCKGAEPVFYVAGSETKELYKTIYGNVCLLLDDLKVSWEKKDRIRKEDLAEENAVIIFCDDVASDYVELSLLEEFIQNGGKVIFAAGLAEGHTDAYLQPVCGIIEKTIKENYQTFRLEPDFLPLQEEQMTYDGYTASTWISVRSAASVYVSDADSDIPVVYTYPYGEGESLIINATFLSDSRCMGFLVAGIGVLLEDFVYPVLGAECVYLDNFPIVTYVNDSVCMKLYGRTTEAFVRDEVWPLFQGMAVRKELKYTSSVLALASKEDVFPGSSESLFNTMGKSALQYDGEMAYAVDCQNAGQQYRNEAFIEDFARTFTNYDISAMVMVSDSSIPESLEQLGGSVHAVRGNLNAARAQERLFFSDAYYVFPEASEGTSLEDGSMLQIASVLTSYGMVSHTFNINELIHIQENQPTWDTDKIKLREFENRVFEKTGYLEDMTLSETKNCLKSYQNLAYTWTSERDTVELQATQFVEGQPFFIRTNGKITGAEHAEIEQVSTHYYLVRLLDTKAVLHIERGAQE